jgi:ankyrin repeat protein
MADRRLPVRPDLDRLMQEAEDLLRAVHRADPSAMAELSKHHPASIEPGKAELADAQLTLARSYGLASWPRLVLACRMTDAIWRDDGEAVRELVSREPRLLHEAARGVERCNWGPPMSYAANLGRKRIVALLCGLGAGDLQLAFDRACLQGRIDTARELIALGARPALGSVMGPAETLNAAGLAFLLELGAAPSDGSGDRLAPVALVLETYSRAPEGKHRCLELFAEHGIDLPDTPPMALHRGRLDLLAQLLRRDPDLLGRTFSHQEIYPPALGCHSDESLALHGTPLAGTTLLHQCVDFDEIEIARWLVERGADVNARAAVDAQGFGGHTPLFGCVVSQPYRVGLRTDDAFARFLLDHGAAPNDCASLRKRLRFVADESPREYHDVTPLAWGARFHDQDWVSQPVLRLIAERGGRE